MGMLSCVSICSIDMWWWFASPLPSTHPNKLKPPHTIHTCSNVDPDRHYSCKYPKGCPMSVYVMKLCSSPPLTPPKQIEATPYHPYLLWCWPWKMLQLQVPKGLSYVSLCDDAMPLPLPHPSKLKALHTIHTCYNVALRGITAANTQRGVLCQYMSWWLAPPQSSPTLHHTTLYWEMIPLHKYPKGCPVWCQHMWWSLPFIPPPPPHPHTLIHTHHLNFFKITKSLLYYLHFSAFPLLFNPFVPHSWYNVRGLVASSQCP